MSHAFERARSTATAAALVIAVVSVFLGIGWAFQGARDPGYPILYGGLTAASAAVALLLRYRPSSGALTALAVVELTGCALLTWLDLKIGNDLIAYTIGIFALGVVYSGGRWAYAALLLGSFAGLVGLTAATWPWRLHQVDYWVVMASLVVAYAGCLLLEQQRRRSDDLAARLEAANAELHSLSYRDPLTGLHNRRALLEALTGQRALAVRTGLPLAVVLLDLDHFKRINDTLGHAVGDEVLKTTARLIGAGLRQTDLAARYGGEEFVLLLPKSDAQGAARVAVRILRQFRNAEVPGVPWPVTFSAGVAQLEDQETVESLLERADRKLYEAKRRRNLVRS